MTRIGWLSQPYPPDGASAGEGIRNQLGRPELDLLTVLVREAAQNSWDARRSSEPVDFQVEISTVGPAHASNWRELMLRDAPANDHLPLRSAIASPVIRIMTVSDRGTTGLGGPTRADQATDVRDFVAFIRNSGEPRDKALGGGTYGFGKGIFYLLSQAGTVLIHTRCETKGGLQTRLIGCALWNSYISSRSGGAVPYTGRHWWGVRGDDGVVEPLVGEEADECARLLGLRPFQGSETGTAIVIIDPNLNEREPAEAAGYLAETITWQLWPKMLHSPGAAPPMRFVVRHGNASVPVPDPYTTTPFSMFVSAYEASRAGNAVKIECFKPRRELGRLGLFKQLAFPVEPSSAAMMAGMGRNIHHVCLMRPTELVVRYLPGPKPMSENLSYAGVFRANDELDEVYARAEPPTHDNWIADNLDGQERTFIRTTFRRIADALDDYIGVGGAIRTSTAAVSLGAASSMFSDLIAGVWGIGGATDYPRLTPPSSQPTSGAFVGSPSGPSRSDSSSQLEVTQPAVGRPSSWGSEEGRNWAGSMHTGGDSSTTSSGYDAAQGNGMGSNSQARSQTGRPVLRYEGDANLDEFDDEVVIVQPFSLPVAGRQVVQADLHVVISSAANAREGDPPASAAIPTVLGWRDAAGRMTRAQFAELEGGDGRIWCVVVRPAPDTVTEIDLKVSAVTSL